MHDRILRQRSTGEAVRGVPCWIFKLKISNRMSSMVSIFLFHFFSITFKFSFFVFLTRFSNSFFFLLLRLNHTATRESPTPSLAFHAPSALQDSSKIKTPSQALHARHVRQDTTAPPRVPRPAPILVAGNPKIAMMTSTLMPRFK